ncbi:hypothetical protein GR160_07120 [Flavobacterium sp. Sd200]|uniref:hypothetical protein n=1 Tax=Flavobacterium sp. Sd200 TaxID=2692211 RepID=UPI00136837F7|nr:hypothetical protein [Flavobacterium sp. Sd200]MXN90996.1 hypothetical protein [Flavobacterium sp. Sd200]
MKTVHIKLLLPYNWWHLRSLKITDGNNQLLTKVKHGGEYSVVLDECTEKLFIKIDHVRSQVDIPADQDTLHLILFLDFRDDWFHKYIDVLKRNCIKGRFTTADDFNSFDSSFYKKTNNWLSVNKINKPLLNFGLAISAALIVTSVMQQNNPYQDLLFFIGTCSTISLLFTISQKNNMPVFDYKSRIIATALLFVLAYFFIAPSAIISILFFTVIAAFIIKSLSTLNNLKVN